MEASGLVGVWDLPSEGQPVLFSTLAARAIDTAFAPDGKSIFTVGVDGRVRSWNLEGQPGWVSQGGHSAPARTIAVTSELIASGGEDGAIRLWRHDGTSLADIPKAHEGPVMSIAIAPGGDLVSLGGDEVVRLWKRAGGSPTLSFEASPLFTPPTRRYPEGFVGLFRFNPAWGWDHSVAFSPRGDVIAAVLFDGSLRLWNADGTSRAVVPEAHLGRQVRALSFSPRGDLIASGGFDSKARLWNLDGTPHGEAIEAHMNNAYSVTFSADGSKLATTGHDNVVRVFNRDGARLFELPDAHSDRVTTVAIAGGKPILAAAFRSGEMGLWNLDGRPRGKPARLKGPVLALAFSPTEDLVASAGSDGMLRLWDLDGKLQGKPVAFTYDGRRKITAAFSPKGDVLALGAGSLQLWDRNRFIWSLPLRPADDVIAMAFSPDGDFILTGSALGDIQVWNRDGSSRVGPLNYHSEWLAAVAVAPKGDFFAGVIGGVSPKVTLFNLDGTPRGEPLEGHSGPVKTLAFSPTGQLASGALDGTVRLWSLPSRQAETIDVGRPIQQLGFSGNLLWARTSNETLFFFNPARQLVATVHMRGHGLLTSTPDGWFSSTARSARTVRAYRADGGVLSEEDTARYMNGDEILAKLTAG